MVDPGTFSPVASAIAITSAAASYACIAVAESVEVPLVLVLEALLHALLFYWTSRFGNAAAPALFGSWAFGRAAIIYLVVAASRQHTVGGVCIAAAVATAFDVAASHIVPYLSIFPDFVALGYSRAVLGAISHVGIYPVIAAFFCAGALLATAWTRRSPVAALLGTCVVTALVWDPGYHVTAAEKHHIYTLHSPRLFQAFDDPKAGAALISETQKLLQKTPSDALVITPEGFFPREINGFSRRLPLDLGSRLPRNMLIGVHVAANSSRPIEFYNSIQSIHKYGYVVGTYAKHTLVPMGEFVPSVLKHTLVENTLSAVGGSFRPETGIRRPVPVDGVLVQPLVCVEVCDLRAWNDIMAGPSPSLLTVHCDGSRFQSAFFDDLQLAWSRLLAASTRSDVLHVPASAPSFDCKADGGLIAGRVFATEGGTTLCELR